MNRIYRCYLYRPFILRYLFSAVAVNLDESARQGVPGNDRSCVYRSIQNMDHFSPGAGRGAGQVLWSHESNRQISVCSAVRAYRSVQNAVIVVFS